MNKIETATIGLLGKKLGMTQIFDEEGRQVPVTVLQVGPCYVTGVRDPKKDGYAAVQLAFDPVREKRSNKAKLGHLKKAKAPSVRLIKEIRTKEIEGLAIGNTVGASNFEAGDFVDVEGTCIGHGFQGVVKRHHFKGDASMGHGSMFGRVPGSIGASSFPSRVVKGMRAAGHMGNDKATVHNLKVVKVDGGNNLLLVKGSVPGAENGYLVVRTSLKRGTKRKWKVEGSSKEAAPAKGGEATSQEESKPEASEAKS